MNREDFIRIDKEDAAFEELVELANKLHEWCIKYDMPNAHINGSKDCYGTAVMGREDFYSFNIITKRF